MLVPVYTGGLLIIKDSEGSWAVHHDNYTLEINTQAMLELATVDSVRRASRRGDRSGCVPILCLFAYSSFTVAVVHGDRILGRNRTVIPVYMSHI